MKNKDNLNFLIMKKIQKEESQKTFFDKIIDNKIKVIFLIFILIFLLLIYYFFFAKLNVHKLENKNNLFKIYHEESINEIGKNLKSKNIIKSEIVFRVAMKLFSNNEIIRAGVYKFDENDNLISIINKISNGEYALPPIKILIPEGSDNQEIINIFISSLTEYKNKYKDIVLSESFSDENIKNIFNNINNENQGYIFPDTYFILPVDSMDIVLKSISNNFDKKIKFIIDNLIKTQKIKIYNTNLKEFNWNDYLIKNKNCNLTCINLDKKITIINDIGTTTTTFKNIIIMASYLEGEAANENDMRIVSGILWTRLKIGMYLQIDAATSTYKNKGFTKNSINNPGEIAIMSAINPIKTPYIYYITDNDGIMRYSIDYNTHLKNINKYLRNRR